MNDDIGAVQHLIETATEQISRQFTEKKHNLCCVMQLESGEIVTGINLQGSFGCVDTCAEQVTLGKILSDQKGKVITVVTVRHPKPDEPDQTIKVASPCGKCRELLLDYAPEALVLVREGSALQLIKAVDLLPHRYSKT